MLEERIWGPPCPPPPPFEREKKRDEKRIKVKIKWTEKKRTMNIFFDAANEQRGKCVDTHTDTQLARLKWEHSENCCWSHLTLNTRIRREDLLLLLLVFLFVRCVCPERSAPLLLFIHLPFLWFFSFICHFVSACTLVASRIDCYFVDVIITLCKWIFGALVAFERHST